MLLPTDCIQPLATMCLFMVDCYTHMAWLENGTVVGVDVVQYQAELKACQMEAIGIMNWMDGVKRHIGDVRRWIISPTSPHPGVQCGDRNVHQMSGRAT